MTKIEQDVEAAPPNNMIALAVATVWRYRVLVLSSTGIGMVLWLFGALVTPNEYRSVGKLFIRPGLRETITPEVAFSGADAGATRTSAREAIQNELQVLSSPQLFDKIVTRVGVQELMAPYDPSGSDGASVAWHTRVLHAFQSWWFASSDIATGSDVAITPMQNASMMLGASLGISPEAGASVISFSYVSHSPELARTVVNAALDAAIEMHRVVFDTMSSLGTIEEELKSAEGIARLAEEQLRTFRVEKGIYDQEAQRDALLSYIRALEHEIDTIDVETVRKQAEQEVLVTLQASIPKERPVLGAETFTLNPMYGALSTFLLQLQQMDLQLDFEKGKNLSAGDFEARKAAIANLTLITRARLEQEGMQLKLETAREENPYYATVTQNIDNRGIELKGLARQKEEKTALLATNRTRLVEFEAMLPNLRKFELDARQKRATADRLADGVTNMRTVQRLEQLKLSNMQVMHGGTFEPVKIGPERGKRLFTGALFGGVVGVALAMLLMWRDRLVRGRQELVWLGVPAQGVLSSDLEPRADAAAATGLPPTFAEVRVDVAHFWATLPYDRRARESLKIAFVPCGEGADASRAAAMLALGLAAHGGERVVYVSCVDEGGWFAERLQVGEGAGWSEVLAGEVTLEGALAATEIAGLSYLSVGAATDAMQHPMAGPSFASLLDQLCANHRFVIVELPDLELRPEGRSVIGIVDAAELVVRQDAGTRESVRDAVAALRIAETRLLGAVLQPAVANGKRGAAAVVAAAPA